MRWTRSTDGSSSPHSACPASWKATTCFSCSFSTRRDCTPAITRSSAASKSAGAIFCALRRVAKIAASLQMFARSAPVRPLVCCATRPRSTSCSGLSRVCTSSTPSRPRTSGGATNTWRSKRPGRSSAGSSFSSRFDAAITTTRPLRGEAVHLDEQLVERLVLLAGDVHAAAPADGVELVDEDDRRLVLARDREQAADPRGAEAGEHLDERRRRLREEAARPTRARRPSRAASCRCRAGRAGGRPSAPARRASGTASDRAGTRRAPAARPSPRRRRRCRRTRPTARRRA